MGYKPTLGGLKKAQEFLDNQGYPMPVFQTDIYEVSVVAGFRRVPRGGRVAHLDELIKKFGPMHAVTDVCLLNMEDQRGVVFTSVDHLGWHQAEKARDDGFDVVIEWSAADPEDVDFKEFQESDKKEAFINIAIWGKPWPTWWDKIQFRLFPRRYASKTFGE